MENKQTCEVLERPTKRIVHDSSDEMYLPDLKNIPIDLINAVSVFLFLL
jgi:hypothetical protein